MNPADRIVRLICIRDTRQFEEGPDDRFHPIPGSGVEHQCFRCGRPHEIHAEVALADGRHVVVGTGCAGRDSAEAAARFRSAEALAKRLARVVAAERAHEVKLATWDRVHAEVQALPHPEVREVVVDDSTTTYHVGEEGYARAFRRSLDRDRPERIACAVRGWEGARMVERGQPEFRPYCSRNFGRERKRIDAALAKLTEPALAA